VKGGPPALLLPSEDAITKMAGRSNAHMAEITGEHVPLPAPTRDKGAGAGAVHCAAFSDDGEFFVVGTETGGVYMVSVDDVEEPVWYKYVPPVSVLFRERTVVSSRCYLIPRSLFLHGGKSPPPPPGMCTRKPSSALPILQPTTAE
jgi:hypothetical protein